MTIRYIGNFPPPYGGVTVKNKLLYDGLSEKVKIRHFDKPDFLPQNIYQFIVVLQALLPGQQLIIGLSSRGEKSRILTRLLFIFNRRTMRRSLYFMMGGTEADRIASNEKEQKWYRNYRRIYVETKSMAARLRQAGLKNVTVYPNCRRRPDRDESITYNPNRKMRCVYFSRIEKEKGVDYILDAAKSLPDIIFGMYGEIDPDYEKEFRSRIDNLDNVIYHGIFKKTGEGLYHELRKYDVMLFLTKWHTEGIPGVIVEAKMAGLPCIVSNMSHNSELIEDGEDGIVLKHNSSEELIEVLSRLDKDRGLLEKLKEGSLRSAERFYFDRYEENIVKNLIRE